MVGGWALKFSHKRSLEEKARNWETCRTEGPSKWTRVQRRVLFLAVMGRSASLASKLKVDREPDGLEAGGSGWPAS